MKKCSYRKCDRVFEGRSNKLYCSENCRSNEKIKKRLDRENSKEKVFLDSIPIINQKNKLFLNDTIQILISYRNVTHFLKLGYNAIINSNLNVYVLDLPSVSHVRVEPICEVCRKVNNIQFNKYMKNKSNGGIYNCKSCRLKKVDVVFDLLKSEERYTEISKISFRRYKNDVRRYTKRSSKKLFMDWDGFDFYDKEYIRDYINEHPNSDLYPSIDHKLSVYHGFINNIPSEIIGGVSNLCITKRIINSTKRDLISEDFKPQNN
jgi:hypothetical protein